MGARDGRGSVGSAQGNQPRPTDRSPSMLWMSVQSVAEELEVTTRTIYRFINDGQLPAYRIDRVYRIRRSDLDEYLAGAALQPGDLDHLLDDSRRSERPPA